MGASFTEEAEKPYRRTTDGGTLTRFDAESIHSSETFNPPNHSRKISKRWHAWFECPLLRHSNNIAATDLVALEALVGRDVDAAAVVLEEKHYVQRERYRELGRSLVRDLASSPSSSVYGHATTAAHGHQR